MHLDQHYTDPRLVALYDLDSGWSEDRDYYLALAQGTVQALKILDLGCGTGLLCQAYAEQGHQVTGIDPSAEMLNAARTKEMGAQIEWIQASAQQLPQALFSRQFDLIIMTGHAFQVLLTPTEIRACFDNIRRLLAPQGRFVFESRNPDFPWAEHWNYAVQLSPREGVSVLERRELLIYEDQRMSFELHYDFGQETLRSESHLYFASQQQIQDCLHAAGLSLQACYGNWQRGPFVPTRSQEMIFHLSLAQS